MERPKVKKLLHTRMRVDNLDKTVTFYTKVLGLEEVTRKKSPRGSELVFLRSPGSDVLVEITHYPSSGPVEVQPDLMHLAFEVESLDAFERHLRDYGYHFSDGPTQGTQSRFAFVDAPEGYEIELIEYGSC